MEGSTKAKQGLLTPNQFTVIIFSGMVGVGVLSLPNGVVKVAHEDAWISVLIGGVYPLYIVSLVSYISSKFPNCTMLQLSKVFFGKAIGTLLNLILFSYFILFSTLIASYYVNLSRNIAMGFLSPLKMIGILYLLIIFTAYKGLKVISRICQVTFYITLLMIFSPLPALKVANITNILPILDDNFGSIIKGSWQSIFSYTGAEIIIIIYPFLKDKKKTFTSSLKAVVITVVLYVWVVFITTFYLGPDIVPKSYWPFLLVTNSVTITIVNNFRYFFILLWSLVAFRSCSLYCFGGFYILKESINKLKLNWISFCIYPLLVYITLKYGNELSRQGISDKITKFFLAFSLLYTTIMAVFAFFKKVNKA